MLVSIQKVSMPQMPLSLKLVKSLLCPFLLRFFYFLKGAKCVIGHSLC